MLMKLTPGVNFTAFMHENTKRVKNTVKLSIFFTLLGSTRVKALRRTLMKLTPGSNFDYSKTRNTGKAQFTNNIFAHNIEIKRYCNKKMKKHFFIQKKIFLCEL
jgi:hypothetical protein